MSDILILVGNPFFVFRLQKVKTLSRDCLTRTVFLAYFPADLAITKLGIFFPGTGQSLEILSRTKTRAEVCVRHE